MTNLPDDFVSPKVLKALDCPEHREYLKKEEITAEEYVTISRCTLPFLYINDELNDYYKDLFDWQIIFSLENWSLVPIPLRQEFLNTCLVRLLERTAK
jgi:hypothetical protein